MDIGCEIIQYFDLPKDYIKEEIRNCTDTNSMIFILTLANKRNLNLYP